MTAIRTIAIAVVLLGGSIWIGSMVCLAVVARVLSTTDRVELFAVSDASTGSSAPPP